MHQHAPENLFTDIKEPDFERTLGSFAPAFVDEREEGAEAERALDEDCEGAEEFALALGVGGGVGRGGGR